MRVRAFGPVARSAGARSHRKPVRRPRAALVYKDFLERKLDTMRGMVSSGYTRRKISPVRAANEKLDDWRDISRGDADES
jgi:hypothetical protein